MLECIDRLLTKNYPPNRIELEKSWQVGHGVAGRLDILVNKSDFNESAYLMIECKTAGEEYEKAKRKTLDDGGQILSYWQQNRSADWLCLYASSLSEGRVEYQNAIVPIEKSFRSVGDVKEVHARWNKQFLDSGIFEEDIGRYGIEIKPLQKKDLIALQEEDGKRIYNQFLEILRHNVISDKGNAFNKIFNLFLCKIFDEDRQDAEELEFQYVEGRDNPEDLMHRLNDLYKQGMKRYLDKNITDYSLDDIQGSVTNSDVEKIFKELRLYKSQEFSFVDVFNEESFLTNTKVVIEIVKLLQRWQIRYTHRQQFLGDFFELLLSTGFKQESGQFFTPVPLVRFILKSLPLEKIIKNRISKRDEGFLPYVVDFACGSGHFLTEAMDVLQELIENLDEVSMTPGQIRKRSAYLADQFGWAQEHIYGIERDYRLVKTAKLAAFLHGDGDAQIVHASGIDPFNTAAYKGVLACNSSHNEKFDVLIANPPFAIDGFKATVESGSNSFSLFDQIPDASKDIEVLFVERMIQLVRPGGVAGIILPNSILNTLGIYELARKAILENFEINAIVALKSKAFMATGINAVVLFLRKRENMVHLQSESDYKSICNGKKVVVVKSGDKTAEQESFLGYKFSNRKGSEGIKTLEKSTLLDESNLRSKERANSYILSVMEGEAINQIDDSVSEYVKLMDMNDMFDWNGESFSNRIRLWRVKIEHENPNYLVSLASIVDYESGKRPRGGAVNEGVWSLGGEHIDGDIGEVIFDGMKFVPQSFFDNQNRGRLEFNDILLCKDGAQTGKGGMFLSKTSHPPAMVNEHVFRMRAVEDKCLQHYLLYYIMSSFFLEQVKMHAYAKKAQPGLNMEHMQKILVFCPPLKTQREIVDKVQEKWDDLTRAGQRAKFIDQLFGARGLSKSFK